MKVALALESPHASPRARALALGRKLAGGGDLVAATCLVDSAGDGPELAARLGLREAFFVADAALAKTGSRGRAQALAQLLARMRVDLILVDAAADGGRGLFSASLAHHAGLPGLFRVRDVTRDDARPDAAVVTLDLGGPAPAAARRSARGGQRAGRIARRTRDRSDRGPQPHVQPGRSRTGRRPIWSANRSRAPPSYLPIPAPVLRSPAIDDLLR